MLPIFLSLIACGPKAPPEAAAEASFDRSVIPSPLERRPFQLPSAQRATLSNGVEVVVVENHELPLVQIRAVFSTGSWTDPESMEGLALSTMDMLNEGAGELDAIGLSKALRELASSLGTSASLDSASVSMSCLSKNLEPTLDLWSSVLLDPTFASGDWERLQKQYIQSVAEQRTTPTSIAGRVVDRVMFGNAYDGRLQTPDSLGSITVDAQREWWSTHLVPANAMLLVGGDATLDSIVPLLEARLAEWTGDTPIEMPTIEVQQPAETTVYLVDKPGAAQSVINVSRFIGDVRDETYYPTYVGNMAWGGMFMARLNMNLREDKGYTYGARANIYSSMAPVQWLASTSVKSDTTTDALSEIFRELEDINGERPLNSDEIAYASSSVINGYPARFETASYLLNETTRIWRYDLPADWLETYIDSVDSVTAESAQAAFSDQLAT
jgi:zinc protease